MRVQTPALVWAPALEGLEDGLSLALSCIQARKQSRMPNRRCVFSVDPASSLLPLPPCQALRGGLLRQVPWPS